MVVYAYPISRCIVCARGAAMPCYSALLMMQGQPAAVQDCAPLWSRCARCDGGLRRVRRSPSRVAPLLRGPELSDDYWFAADRCSLVFRATSPKWESTSSYCHDATTSPRVDDKAHTLRPRRRRRRGKAQEVVEEPRREVVVLRREVQTVQQTRGARLPSTTFGLPRRDGAVARVPLHRRRAPGVGPPVVSDQLEEGQHTSTTRLLDHGSEHVVAPPLTR